MLSLSKHAFSELIASFDRLRMLVLSEAEGLRTKICENFQTLPNLQSVMIYAGCGTRRVTTCGVLRGKRSLSDVGVGMRTPCRCMASCKIPFTS